VVVVNRPPVEAAAVQAPVRAVDGSRVDEAVRAAVSESEARQAHKTAELVEAARRDIEFQRRADRVQFEETLMLLQKRYNGLLVASADYGGRP
jgi:hypothetical protein